MFLTAGWVLALTECRRAPPPFWEENVKRGLGIWGLPDPTLPQDVRCWTSPSPSLCLSFFTSINEQMMTLSGDCCGIKLIQ